MAGTPAVTVAATAARAGDRTVHQTTYWSHRSQLPGEAASASVAREIACKHLLEHGLGGVVGDLRLVVSELATNAIMHAGTPFTLTLRGDDRSVLLEVRDGSALAAVLLPLPSTGASGRGLAIVERLSDRWGIAHHADGGKSVWAWFE
jgi:anti-sigma regulatory factor (Ser/Thr protein kinase)